MIYIIDRRGRPCAQIPETEYSAVMESYDNDASSFTAPEGAMTPDDAGRWLLWQGSLFYISKVTPGEDESRAACQPPEAAFDRKLLWPGGTYASIGACIKDRLEAEFRDETDPAYALPALTVYNYDNTSFVPPELSGDEDDAVRTYNLCDYIRTVRDAYDVFTEFSLTSQGVRIDIRRRSRERHNVIFRDGHAWLDSQSYGSADSVAKVTTLQGGVRRNWYLAADGGIHTTPPAERAVGRWELLPLGEDDDPEAAARDAFGDAAGGHKIVFSADRRLRLGDVCYFRLGGKVVTGRVSYVSRTDEDELWHYKSGDLAATFLDKMKRRG